MKNASHSGFIDNLHACYVGIHIQFVIIGIEWKKSYVTNVIDIWVCYIEWKKIQKN